MLSAIAADFPLVLPYGATCLAAYLFLYVLFRHALPLRLRERDTGARDECPWKTDAGLTAHRLVALVTMCHWCYLGFRHLAMHDYSGDAAAARAFVPAGFEIAERAAGALLLWDVPAGMLGGAGPPDLLMHLHHAGMLVVIAIVLVGRLATHIAPIFLGAIELSSIPLQIVDLFHPKKSPHWHAFAAGAASRGPFARLCAAANETARPLFALLFLLVRGLYFPWAVATIAVPDLYQEGSVPSLVLLVLSVLFTLLQMYWATLVLGQVKKALGGKPRGDAVDAGKEE